jgi:hypothetical protein
MPVCSSVMNSYWLWVRPQSRRSAPFPLNAHDLCTDVGERIERCIDGRRWLRNGFGKTDGYEPSVDIRPSIAAVLAPVVTRMRLRPILPKQPESDLVCEVDLPADWFAGPIDGVLAWRFMDAFLHVLNAVRDKHGLGPLRLRRSVSSWPRQDLPRRLFEPLGAPSAAELVAQRVLADHVGHFPPGGLVLAGRAEVTAATRQRQQRVASALHAREVSESATAPSPTRHHCCAGIPGVRSLATAPTWRDVIVDDAPSRRAGGLLVHRFAVAAVPDSRRWLCECASRSAVAHDPHISHCGALSASATEWSAVAGVWAVGGGACLGPVKLRSWKSTDATLSPTRTEK